MIVLPLHGDILFSPAPPYTAKRLNKFPAIFEKFACQFLLLCEHFRALFNKKRVYEIRSGDN